ncbi:MAG: hypothetical protein ACOY4Q_11770 [Bacillota bacterium]
MSKKTLTIIAAIIVLGIVGVSGVLLNSLYGTGQTTPEPDPAGQSSSALSEGSFPQNIAGLSLAQVTSGDQAMGMISQLHGKEITIKQGYIAQYGGAGGSQMTVWVSESNNETEAVQLMDIMDKKMPASKAFSGRKELTVNGAKVVNVQGMGQEHYYWQKGTKVYWIAVGGADPMQVLKEAMKSL